MICSPSSLSQAPARALFTLAYLLTIQHTDCHNHQRHACALSRYSSCFVLLTLLKQSKQTTLECMQTWQ